VLVTDVPMFAPITMGIALLTLITEMYVQSYFVEHHVPI